MLEIDESKGEVVRRTILPDVRDVEDTLNNFRGTVYMDSRDDKSLLRMPNVPGAETADLDMLIRARSDEELDALNRLSKDTRRLLDNPSVNSSTFRGEAKNMGNLSYFKVHKGTGFVEYRGGMQDRMGRCSDLTRVEPTNDDWKFRGQRVEEGLQAVERAATAYTSLQDLEEVFKSYLDSDKDEFVSGPIHFTGYKSRETFRGAKTLEPYDFITIGACMSDGTDTAFFYRSTKQIIPPPTPTPPRPATPEPPETVQYRAPETTKPVNMSCLLSMFSE